MPPPLQPLRILTPQEAARSLPHKLFGKAQIIFAVGRPENGKTTFMREYIESCEPRVLAPADRFLEFGNLRARASFWQCIEDLKAGDPCRRRFIPPELVDMREFGRALWPVIIREVRDCLVVLDELQLLTDENPTQAFEQLVLDARKWGLRLLVATHEIHFAPAVLQGRVTQFVLFNVQGKNNLQRCAQWGRDERLEEILPTLQQGQCLVVSL